MISCSRRAILFIVPICVFVLLCVFMIAAEAGDLSRSGKSTEKVEKPKGLSFTLSTGEEPFTAENPQKTVAGKPLSGAEVEEILKRMPPFETPAKTESFKAPSESLPPPRAGKIVAGEFPPLSGEAIQPAGGAAAGLEVVRYSPEGAVPSSPHLSVTFSQPMVPVTSLEELSRLPVPVKVTPQPKGRWRWIGTKTLLFEPEKAFPMATHYRVTIPEGTESILGGTLSKAVTWTFSTPPPGLVKYTPTRTSALRDGMLFAAFDQRVVPADMLKKIKVTAGEQSFPVRLTTEKELAHDAALAKMAKDAGEGRWLAFRTISPLPYDSPVQVSVEPGAPSAEGPMRTEKPQEWSYQTYGPLKIESALCRDRERCLNGFELGFSNPLGAETRQDR